METSFPGAFPLNQPYGMPARTMKTLGIRSPVQGGTPGMPGTVATAKGSGGGTALNVAKSSVTAKLAAGDLEAVPKMKTLFGGGQPVRPKMEIVRKPTEPQMIRMASAYPSIEDIQEALMPESQRTLGRLLTKQGSQLRLTRVFELLGELEGSSDLHVKVAALLRLAEVKKEALLAQALRRALPVGK